MLRTPVERGSNKGQILKSLPWPAPTSGWRTDIPIGEMQAKDPYAAALLINFFPEPGFIRARNGNYQYATGLQGSVESLMPYSGVLQKLFAAGQDGIYDVSAAGPVAPPVVTGITSYHFSSAQLSTGSGYYLTCCNGTESPWQYNGTTWSQPSFTGPSSLANLHVVVPYRERLYFLEKGTTNIWYGGTSAITGALTSFAVGPDMKYGGSLVAMSTWTAQTLTGVLMFLCIMTSNGELLVYQGSNPGDSTNWSLLGTFKLSWPLGADRCMMPLGGDLVIMTTDGIIPASKAISLDPSASDQASITSRIAPTWLQVVHNIGVGQAHWQFITYPNSRMAIVNVPDQAFGTYQFIMNTETLAWTQFNGMAATVWADWNNGLFFGDANGNVNQADYGSNDQGAAIQCTMIGAWQNLGDGLSPKLATMIGIDTILDQNATVSGNASFDYTLQIPNPGAVTAGASSAEWDVALWDQAMWPGSVMKRVLADAGGEGVVFAPTVGALISGSVSQLTSCHILGGALHVQPGRGI